MIRRSTMFLPALLLAAAACSGTESSLLGSDVTDPTALTSRFIAPASVALSPDSATIEVGKTIKLAGTVFNRDGHAVPPVNTVAMRWMSSDTTIAKVSGSGVVIALRPGSVLITALAGSVAASSTIGVHAAAEAVPSTGVSKAAPSTPVSDASGATAATTTTTTPSTTSTTTTTTTTTTSSTRTTAAPSTSTTTTPAPTPSAPVASATGPGLSGKALLSDDFTEYATTADLQHQITVNIGGTGDWKTSLYRDGFNPQLASIDSTMRYNGHATMKYTQPGGTAATPALWVTLPHSVSTMWLRAKIRFGPGFTTTGTLTNAAYAYKLLGWGLAGVNGSGRLEITNTTEYDLYWGAVASGTGATVVPNTDQGGGPTVTTEWTDGGWRDYIIEYSVTGPTTGIARAWLARDGQTPQLIMTRTRTAEPGYSMPEVNSICLGLNFNQVRRADQNQALWYGQWEVVDGAAHPDPFGVNGGQN